MSAQLSQSGINAEDLVDPSKMKTLSESTKNLENKVVNNLRNEYIKTIQESFKEPGQAAIGAAASATPLTADLLAYQRAQKLSDVEKNITKEVFNMPKESFLSTVKAGKPAITDEEMQQ